MPGASRWVSCPMPIRAASVAPSPRKRGRGKLGKIVLTRIRRRIIAKSPRIYNDTGLVRRPSNFPASGWPPSHGPLVPTLRAGTPHLRRAAPSGSTKVARFTSPVRSTGKPYRRTAFIDPNGVASTRLHCGGRHALARLRVCRAPSGLYDGSFPGRCPGLLNGTPLGSRLLHVHAGISSSALRSPPGNRDPPPTFPDSLGHLRPRSAFCGITNANFPARTWPSSLR